MRLPWEHGLLFQDSHSLGEGKTVQRWGDWGATEVKTTRGSNLRRGTDIKTTCGFDLRRGTDIKTTCGFDLRRGTDIETTRGFAFRRGTDIKTTCGFDLRRGTDIKTTRGFDLRRSKYEECISSLSPFWYEVTLIRPHIVDTFHYNYLLCGSILISMNKQSWKQWRSLNIKWKIEYENTSYPTVTALPRC